MKKHSFKVDIKRLDPDKYELIIPESENKKYEFVNWEKILKDIEDNEKEMDNSKTIN